MKMPLQGCGSLFSSPFKSGLLLLARNVLKPAPPRGRWSALPDDALTNPFRVGFGLKIANGALAAAPRTGCLFFTLVVVVQERHFVL